MNLARPARPVDVSEVAWLAGELGYSVDVRAMAARRDRAMGDPRERLRVVGAMGLAG